MKNLINFFKQKNKRRILFITVIYYIFTLGVFFNCLYIDKQPDCSLSFDDEQYSFYLSNMAKNLTSDCNIENNNLAFIFNAIITIFYQPQETIPSTLSESIHPDRAPPLFCNT